MTPTTHEDIDFGPLFGAMNELAGEIRATSDYSMSFVHDGPKMAVIGVRLHDVTFADDEHTPPRFLPVGVIQSREQWQQWLRDHPEHQRDVDEYELDDDALDDYEEEA